MTSELHLSKATHSILTPSFQISILKKWHFETPKKVGASWWCRDSLVRWNQNLLDDPEIAQLNGIRPNIHWKTQMKMLLTTPESPQNENELTLSSKFICGMQVHAAECACKANFWILQKYLCKCFTSLQTEGAAVPNVGVGVLFAGFMFCLFALRQGLAFNTIPPSSAF